MNNSTYPAPAQGFSIGDTVRIGKGKTDWTVVERVALGEYTLQSEKGARRSVTRETVLLGVGEPLPVCGEAYAKYSHSFTCTLNADGHTEHADQITDAPATVHWTAEPAELHDAHVNDAQDFAVQNWAVAVIESEQYQAELRDSTDREALETVHVDNPHVDYPHTPGYLDTCHACTSGPCVCNGPDRDSLTPCWSDECERQEPSDGGPYAWSGDEMRPSVPVEAPELPEPAPVPDTAQKAVSVAAGPVQLPDVTAPLFQRREYRAPNRAERRAMAKKGKRKPNGAPNFRFL